MTQENRSVLHKLYRFIFYRVNEGPRTSLIVTEMILSLVTLVRFNLILAAFFMLISVTSFIVSTACLIFKVFRSSALPFVENADIIGSEICGRTNRFSRLLVRIWTWFKQTGHGADVEVF